MNARRLLCAGIAVFAFAACQPAPIVKLGPAVTIHATTTTLSSCAQGDEPEGC